MTDMIEQVAKALSIADGMHPNACSNDEDETPMWKLYVDDARAAIAAMRWPTGAMIAAGVNKYENGDPNEYCSASGFQDAWQAAIDEALK